MNNTIEHLNEVGPRLVSSREAAAILGIHKETLYRWVKDGTLRATRIGGRVKFDPGTLVEYLRARTT